MKQSKMNRILSLLLGLALCLQMLPAVPALAESMPGEQTVSTAAEEQETVVGIIPEAVPDADEPEIDKSTQETDLEDAQETPEDTQPEEAPDITEPSQPEEVPDITEPSQPEEVPDITESTQPEDTQEDAGEETEPALITDALELQEDVAETEESETLMTRSVEDTLDAILRAEKTGESEYVFAPGVYYTIDDIPTDSMELLRELIGQYGTKGTWSGDTLKTLELEDGRQLILLSNTDPSVYQNAEFTIGSITGKVINLMQDFALQFRGLGSKANPFQGKFMGAASFTVGDTTLFRYLDYTSASFGSDTISVQQNRTGTSNSMIPIIAENITSAPGKNLTVVINNSGGTVYGAMFGTINGDLNLTVSVSNAAFDNRPDSHAGMIANHVQNSSLNLTVNAFPAATGQNYAIKVGTNTESNHAGLLVGYLEKSALTLSAMTFPKSRVESVSGGAGSIAGKMTDASIVLTGSVNLAKAELLGKQTGGIAGIAENVSLTFDDYSFEYSSDGIQVKIGGSGNVLFDSKINSAETGGIFGEYTCHPNQEDTTYYLTYNGTGFSFPATLELSAAAGCAGGLFGKLVLKGVSFEVKPSGENALGIASSITVSGAVDVGGLVGQLEGNGPADTLKVSNAEVTIGTTGNPQYYGGLAGSVSKASVRADTVTVTANTTAVSTYRGFGGLVGLLGNDCVLNTENTVSISTESATISAGGGLVGQANPASVVRLSGTTDLSSVRYNRPTATTTPTDNTNFVGQLVGYQNSALIFATGNGRDENWTYNRSSKSDRVDDNRVDDIGNYGQVIRLVGELSSDLIKVNNDNSVTFKGHPSNGYGTISSADDFALHAITFTSGNAFGIYPDFNASTSVRMTVSIDLSGTGIQGLTRDNGTDMFNGNTDAKIITFDGGENTLIINTGEVYGTRDGLNVTTDDVGSGQCYRHGYYGLLGKVNSAIVQNLTIQTTMHFGADVPTYAGAVMGYVDGGNASETTDNTISDVTVTDSTITYTGDAVSNVGGFIGGVFGVDTGVKILRSTSDAALSYNSKSTNAVLGGAVGKDTYHTSITMTFDTVAIGGSITSNVATYARVGGLVGDIIATNRNTGNATVTMKGVTISSAITTQATKNSARYSSGGFLGYYWDNVMVTFDGSGGDTAVTVKGASLTTQGSAVGGLCYAATGKWDMKEKAVAFDTITIDNKTGDLGLLVCHGERQNANPGSYSRDADAKALYLVMGTNWSAAYTLEGVIISGTPEVYDEIVAYTAADSDIQNNDAGIISLRTTGTGVVMDKNDTRNTYENRIGKFVSTVNPNSRYYYNLDTMGADDTDGVSSPAELVLWSVYKYCAPNIKKLLPAEVTSKKITGDLDMKGYSYYPVTIANTDVEIKDATITFYNGEIETLENKKPVNKSTLNTSGKTQHFTMHSGLFYNYYADDTGTQGTKTLMVRDLTLRGTVGMVGSGSGALICGKLSGTNNTYSVALDLAELNLYDDSGHVAVADFKAGYAPLLIHQVDSYAQLDITNVTARKTNDEAYVSCGTSLIGNVGISDQPMGMSLTFSQMKLADESGNSCFTKATLLNKLYYQSDANSAVYNFTEEEDWSDANHTHNVTYGSEIGTSAEYGEGSTNPCEKKYSPSADGTQKEVYHPGEKPNDFSSYLPYVADKSLDANKHEIQVNGTMPDVDSGCGTYGDPYRVDANQLQSIAKYISLGTASKDWELNFPTSNAQGESTFCSGGETATHATYSFTGTTGQEWQKKGEPTATITKETVQAYLSNAYYQLTVPTQEGEEQAPREMTLNNFSGLGTLGNPFRGVIVGDDITVKLTGTLPSGFINYSYGSVVKDLTLKIQGNASVQFQKITSNSGYVMEAFYGGVMGCILGGDNIVQDVNVDYTGSQIKPTVDKPHLVPIGGYVGMIQGGGVIFRGANELKGEPSALVNNEHYFYVNSYVGRVLQGFALNEGTSSLNNSEKNYQICVISGNGGIMVAGSDISLSSAQALLIFSSITNSGGAGGGQLRSYLTDAQTTWNSGGFSSTAIGGKVRNANYTNVGNATEENPDYQKSLKDDFAAFGAGNTSYLDTKYAGGSLWNVCGSTAYSLTFADGAYDMSAYGNGYRSISPRYLSTAVCTRDGTVNYQRLNPLISGVNGNGARIQPNVTVKEYVDDEYHAIAVGGLFNTVRLIKNTTSNTAANAAANATTFSNLIIGGSVDKRGTISHEYYQWVGTDCQDATHKNWGTGNGFTNLSYGQGRGLIAAGGFAGNTSMEASNTNVMFDSINTQYLYIKSPFDAGGILGHTGLRVASSDNFTTTSDTEKNYYIWQLSNPGDAEIVPSFHNCTFQSLSIDGGWMVGGYIGVTTYSSYAPPQGKNKADYVTQITFDEDRWLGKDASIICKRPKSDSGIDSSKSHNGNVYKCLPAAGGLIGCSRYKVNIANEGRASLEKVEVRSSRSTGGVIGWPFYDVTIKNVDVIGDPQNKTQIGDLRIYGSKDTATPCCEFAGGFIGYFESYGPLTVTDCKVENLLVVASYRSPNGNSTYPCYAAGIVGDLNAGGNHTIANCSAKNLKLANDNMEKIESWYQSGSTQRTLVQSFLGGLVGRVGGGTLFGANLLADGLEFSPMEEFYKKSNTASNDRVGYILGGVGHVDRSTYLAGVSIQNPTSLPAGATLVLTDIGGTTTPNSYYIAYADYTNTAQNTEGDDKLQQGTADVKTVAAEPYVTTSPKGVEIPIGPAASDGKKPTIYLYGDGANPTIVNQIWKDIVETSKSPGRYYHTKPKGFLGNELPDDYNFEKYCTSDFYKEMGLTEETAKGIPNFPVLQVPVKDSSDAEAITNEIVGYLNLITNNGYHIANDKAASHVACQIDRYVMKDGYFEVNEKDYSVLAIDGNSFKTMGYDTGKKQFELLTVTFTEQKNTYVIQVPIVVRRMLEVDFTATLIDNPSFREKDYERYGDSGFKPNITVGYGVTVSALLQYRYNSAIGENQSYNWEYLLNTDGSLGDPGQSIQFYNGLSKLKSLPKGTQLVLIDCADNAKAYQHEIAEQSETEGSKILLSEFADSDGNPYSRWLSEIIGVKVEGPSAEGKWVCLGTDTTGATARVDGQFYRLWKEGDTGDRYDLTVENPCPTQQFYLVIYIPESSVDGIPETTGKEGKNLNGAISTFFGSSIQTNVNIVRKKESGEVSKDPQVNSESTYNFLSGYTQKLEDLSEYKTDIVTGDPEAYKLLSSTEDDGSYLLKMDFKDTITVAKGQKETVDTPMYFKANISLPSYVKSGESVKLSSANGFPTGCNGTAEFYVYTVDNNGNPGTYYYWSEGRWKEESDRKTALFYDWKATGRNMELFLGTKNTSENAVSLAQIREIAKDGNEKFAVEVKMDIHMSVLAAQEVIAGSIQKGDAYTKLSCTSYLFSAQDINTNYVTSYAGEVRYYQSRSGSSTLTHSANDPTQLGINCSDLASANGVIYTTGVYDLNTLSNAAKLLDDADHITYSLTLWQRQENDEYRQVTEDLNKHLISLRMNDISIVPVGGVYQWTDRRSAEFTTADPENAKRFLLPIRVQVNTDVEANGVTFANYQLRLTAELYSTSERLDYPVNKIEKTQEITYDYVTYTITRVITSGYWSNPPSS